MALFRRRPAASVLVVVLGLFLALAVLVWLGVRPAGVRRALMTYVMPSPLDTAVTPAPGVRDLAFGVIGDSNSDEYHADDRRGGSYAATTWNWVELLVRRRGLNFGAWGNWGEPRRQGYEYNWARTGAVTAEMLQTGQHTGLAQQVAQGRVTHVVVWIGGNDFAQWNGTYQDIYFDRLSDAEVQAKVDRVAGDIAVAVDTILAARRVPMVIVSVGDIGRAPDTHASLPEPARRQRVTRAIDAVNAQLAELARTRGVAFVDSMAMLDALAPRLNPQGYLNLGGEAIRVLGKGDEPHQGRLGDGVGHPGTAMSGLIANYILIEPLNRYSNLGIPPLGDQEILASAGLASPAAAPIPPR